MIAKYAISFVLSAILFGQLIYIQFLCAFKIRKQIIMRHIAWMTSLRHALRQHKPLEFSKMDKPDQEYLSRLEIREFKYTLEEELEGYVSQEEMNEILIKKE